MMTSGRRSQLIINDRWGKVRSKHGDYFTTEYGAGFEDPKILWEENRGIGKSFGFNRAETLQDYNSEKLLVFMLVDFVSRGGNFLLNIGPTADGRIPVIMEDRLIRLGEWLEVNGEAIYGSRRWENDSQWSEGERIVYTKKDFHFGQPIFEMTLNPRPGQAVKELFFTRNEDTLYAISPKWPDGDTLVIRDVHLEANSEVSLLGSSVELPWKQEGHDLVIDISSVGINDVPEVGIMYTFKLAGVHAAH
jgi:alpha-L-fucosidase